MGQIDASYRLLFSSPALMQALLATPWLAPLTQAFDLSSLKPVSNDLLSSRLRQRRADLVWQVKRTDGTLVYALILLEHQSRVDTHMALRVSTYCHLLMEDILRRRAASKGLTQVRHQTGFFGDFPVLGPYKSMTYASCSKNLVVATI